MDDILSLQLTDPSSEPREACHTKEGKDDLVKDNVPTPRFLSKSSTWNSPSCAEGVYLQNYMVDHQRLQISDLHFDKFPYTFHALMWEDEIQDRSFCLFRISLGGNAVDQKI